MTFSTMIRIFLPDLVEVKLCHLSIISLVKKSLIIRISSYTELGDAYY